MQRTCVVGMGHIGHRHAQAYTESDKAQLVAVCDRVPELARAAGEKFGVPYFTNAEEMFRAMKPDITSVTTGGYEYSSDHYEPTIQALEAGSHVLGEKPISDTLRHAVEMVELAEKKGLCYGIDMNHRFTPAARQAKKWQDDGRIGSILFCNMSLWIGKFMPLESVYYHLKALNPHSINIMHYFCGPITEVATFAMMAPGRNIYSTQSTAIRFESGAVGHLTSSYDIERGHPMERCEVAGTNGRLTFEDMWREAVLYPVGTPLKEVYTNPVFDGPNRFERFYDTFRDRIHAFVDQVDSGAKPEEIDGSGREGLEASRVIHAMIKSIENGGAVVKVSEVND